jgi:hypothetical protein
VVDVQRDAGGRIIAVRQGGEGELAAADVPWEATPADDPGLAVFAAQIQSSDPSNPLVGTDLALARVLEDLVNLLIDKSVIRFTDLPQGAQAKLLARHNTREALSRLRLMADVDPENREIF